MTQDLGASASRPGSREPSREGVSAASGFDPSRDEWPERAIRIAEALEFEVTSVRGDSLWCRLCERDIGEDGQDHARHCVLYNDGPGLPIPRSEAAEDALRSLAAYVGAGGYNAATVDPAVFEDKVRWGIDHLLSATVRRCADVVEEQSKNPARATYGAIKQAILRLAPASDSDGSPQGRDREDGLDGEAATARAEGIAQTPSPSLTKGGEK